MFFILVFIIFKHCCIIWIPTIIIIELNRESCTSSIVSLSFFSVSPFLSPLCIFLPLFYNSWSLHTHLFDTIFYTNDNYVAFVLAHFFHQKLINMVAPILLYTPCAHAQQGVKQSCLCMSIYPSVCLSVDKNIENTNNQLKDAVICSEKGTITRFELLFEGHSADSAIYDLLELQIQYFLISYYSSSAPPL